jgi:hypothetical protein
MKYYCVEKIYCRKYIHIRYEILFCRKNIWARARPAAGIAPEELTDGRRSEGREGRRRRRGGASPGWSALQGVASPGRRRGRSPRRKGVGAAGGRQRRGRLQREGRVSGGGGRGRGRGGGAHRGRRRASPRRGRTACRRGFALCAKVLSSFGRFGGKWWEEEGPVIYLGVIGPGS